MDVRCHHQVKWWGPDLGGEGEVAGWGQARAGVVTSQARRCCLVRGLKRDRRMRLTVLSLLLLSRDRSQL